MYYVFCFKRIQTKPLKKHTLGFKKKFDFIKLDYNTFSVFKKLKTVKVKKTITFCTKNIIIYVLKYKYKLLRNSGRSNCDCALKRIKLKDHKDNKRTSL